MKKTIATIMLFSASSIFASGIYTAEEILASPEKYDGQVITVSGKMEIEHFETVNLGGITVDWECRHGSFYAQIEKDQRASANASWNRFLSWQSSGINNQMVTITALFTIDKHGAQLLPNTPVLTEIKSIKQGEKEVSVECHY